jgi:hypothetical protein
VTPRLARTSAETPGGSPGPTMQRGRAAPRQLRANKQIDKYTAFVNNSFLLPSRCCPFRKAHSVHDGRQKKGVAIVREVE